MIDISGLTNLQKSVLLVASAEPHTRCDLVVEAGFCHGATGKAFDDLVSRGFLHIQVVGWRTGYTITDAGERAANLLFDAGVRVKHAGD